MLARYRHSLSLFGFDYYTWASAQEAGQAYSSTRVFSYSGLFRFKNGSFIAKPAYFAFRKAALKLERCRTKGPVATVCAASRVAGTPPAHPRLSTPPGLLVGLADRMARIPTNIADHVGSTPMVELARMTAGLEAELFAKLEAMNPGGSVKDRIGVAMIEAAEREGRISPGSPRSSRRQAETPGSRSRSSARPRATSWC